MTKHSSADASKRVAIIMTSSISFNQLMRGQLEFFRSQGIGLDLYSGGPRDQLDTLKERKVGRVCYLPMRREPNLFWDVVCLSWLIMLMSFRRYDAVVYSTPKAMFLGSLAALITRQRNRIAWLRGRAYENFFGAKRRFYVALDEISFRASHKILLVSPSLADACRKDGLSLANKAVIIGHGSSNGVDVDRFKPLSKADRSAVRANLGLSPTDFVIVIVGRIREDKGANEILQLSRRLADIPNIKFLMVGSIEEVHLAEEIDAHHDRLRSFAPTANVEAFFQVADLHLFLSRREGFGNVAIEAAAAGLPTFGFDVVGVRNSVIDKETGELFRFGDLNAVENAIRSAVSDPAAFKRRFSGARSAVEKRFAQREVWRGHARLFVGRLS